MLHSDNNMKCVCVSCFNHYETRIKHIRNFIEEKGYKTIYITSNFNHFEKVFFTADYPDTIQISVPRYDSNISLARIFSQLTFAWKTYKTINRISPDIIYCMFPPNSLVALISHYKKIAGCKVVFDGYDMWPESLPVNGVKKKILSPFFMIWAGLRDKFIEKGDLLVVVAQNFKETAKKRWPKIPVKLLLPGIITSNLPTFSFSVEGKLSFCYLGNINNITDIDLIIALFNEIKRIKDIDLHIIGAGKYLVELLNKANSIGVNCISYGVVMDEKKKKNIYSKCNMGINLPKEEIHSTMSLKSVEYMAVGLPFVNSGGGDNWDIVDKWKVGVNIDRKNICESAQRILTLSNIELMEMSTNCINYSKERFESQNLDTILDIF